MTDGAAVPPASDAPEPTHDELLARLPLDKRRKIEAVLAQLPIIHHSGKKAVEWEAGSWRIMGLAVYWLGILGLSVMFWTILWSIASGAAMLQSLLLIHALFITLAAWSRRPALRLVAAANGVVNAGLLLTFGAQFALETILLTGAMLPAVFFLLVFGLYPGFLLWLNLKWTLVEHRVIAKIAPAVAVGEPVAVARPAWRLAVWRWVATIPGWYLIWRLLDSLVLNPYGPVTSMSVVSHVPPVFAAIGLLCGGLFINNLRLRLIAAASMVVLAYVLTALFLWGAWTSIWILGLAGLCGLATHAGWLILQADIAAFQRQAQEPFAPSASEAPATL